MAESGRKIAGEVHGLGRTESSTANTMPAATCCASGTAATIAAIATWTPRTLMPCGTRTPSCRGDTSQIAGSLGRTAKALR